MSLYSKEEIYSASEYKFKDVSKDDVYYNYINLCANEGIMIGDGNNFRSQSNLTLSEANSLIEKINLNGDKNISLNDSNMDKEVSYGLWVELFYQALVELSDNKVYENYGISYTTPVVLATNEDNSTLQTYMITENGKLNALNLDLSAYRDYEIGVYEKNGEIVMVNSLVSTEPIIENAYVCEYSENSITIFTGGVYRSYTVNGGSNQNLEGSICDIQIEGNTAKSININTNIQNMKVRKIDNGIITLNENEYEFDDNFKIYGEYGNTLTFENKNNIRVGEELKFIISENVVLAGVFEEEIYPKRMRVLLNDTSYANTLHKEVIISSDAVFYVDDVEYEKNETLVIDKNNYMDIFNGDYVEIVPSEGHKLTIKSIKRANDYSPSYRGILEIIKVDNGFNIISDVSMDEYLYQVVPSEMPSSYGVSASELQALCARTYAYKEYYAGKYEKYGANVDDSTNCQVYNNIPDTEISIMAVDKTSDEIITYKGNPVDTFFYSTSGGTTASVGDVWTTNIENFPSESIEYLKSTVQHDENEIDLTNEDSVYEFYKNTDIDAPESDVNWFRWNFTLQKDELSTTINNNLESLYQKRPDLILTKQSDGTYISEPINSVGLVKDVNVIKRGDGGNVIILEIVGSDRTIMIYTELYIRSLIRPYQYIPNNEPITLNMVGTKMQNYTIMPSSFFTMDKTYGNDGVESITFYGGGNGHGVGLSQNGANELLNSGMSVLEVIEHYYTGAVVESMK